MDSRDTSGRTTLAALSSATSANFYASISGIATPRTSGEHTALLRGDVEHGDHYGSVYGSEQGEVG